MVLSAVGVRRMMVFSGVMPHCEVRDNAQDDPQALEQPAHLVLEVTSQIDELGAGDDLLADEIDRECRDFRVRAAIVDPKEVPDGPTQDPSHT